MDGELLSCLGNGGFLCKQFSGFFNAFTLKSNVLIPVCQQLLLCQEKLVHFEGVGCSFAGDTLRCLWVTELLFFFRTEIPPCPPLDGGTREQPQGSCYPFLAALQKHRCKCDAEQTAPILAVPRKAFHPAQEEISGTSCLQRAGTH